MLLWKYSQQSVYMYPGAGFQLLIGFHRNCEFFLQFAAELWEIFRLKENFNEKKNCMAELNTDNFIKFIIYII